MMLKKYLGIGLISIFSISIGFSFLNNERSQNFLEFKHSDIDYSKPTSPLVNLNLGSDIPKDNILWKTSFEDEEYTTLMFKDISHRVSDMDSFTGNKSVYIENKDIFDSSDIVDKKKSSKVMFDGVKNLEPGTNFYVSFVAKGVNEESELNLSSSNSNIDKWEKYIISGVVDNSENYTLEEKSLKELSSLKSQGGFYIDDLTFGYAPKNRIYKNGKQVFEGYKSNYKDIAKDVTPPSKVSNIKTNIKFINDNERNLEIELIHYDLGTNYIYKSAVLDINGIESKKSNPVTVNIKTGIDGYSYLIDTSNTTEPDNSIDIKHGNKISKKIRVGDIEKDYYLHIKSIDKAGNISPTSHIKIDFPILSAVANIDNNGIGLNWDIDTNLEGYKYKMHRKEEGESSYKTISTYDYESGKKIEVLNLYPYNRTVGTPHYTQTIEEVYFKTWDGESRVMVTSASLKKWMEEPNDEHERGYGKGLIEVTPVKIDDYNADPESILKNIDGSWKYDVIFIGSWDANAGNSISEENARYIKDFIDDGGGVLFSHDVTNEGKFPNWYMDYLEMHDNGPIIGSSEIYIAKKSSLNDFPWDIGDVGKVLNIPHSHTSNVKLKNENISMKFKIDKPGNEEGIHGNKIEEDEIYSNNSYLSTYNNVGLVETGHSNGLATSDEQKILANTMFYLSQLTTDKEMKDLTVIDRAKPSSPSISNFNIDKDGEFLNIKFNQSEDFGTYYNYYVEAISIKDNTTKVSNVKSVEFKSGIKGYSYEIDSFKDTVPDDNVDLDANQNTIALNINDIKQGSHYLHLVAIDNDGNKSDALHYNINNISDNEKPKIDISLSNYDFTNEDIQLIVSASDNTAVDYIILPNGQKVGLNKISYTVSNNGVYSFIAVDIFGNSTVEEVSVNNIDKIKPTLQIYKDPNEEWSSSDVNILIEAKE